MKKIKKITARKAQAGDVRLLYRRFHIIISHVLSNAFESDIGPLRCYKVISIRRSPFMKW